ncbi:MAG TPA: alpha/beta hydrolase [Solirubrobacterales bacterium]|nr:alpha/beta hydrolase [Solirubrobacterales bacterium]
MPEDAGSTALKERPRPEATDPRGPDPYGNPDPEWLRIDWAKHRRRLDVGRTRVNYVEMEPPEGAERDPCALVFIHGLSGCWQNWLEQVPHFARRHRVIALDLPGFGDSPPPPWDVSIRTYGRLLLEFAEALDLGDCAVIGNSMGGFVAAETAIAKPGRFEKIVLCSAAGVSTSRLRKRPTAVVARMLAAGAPLLFRLQDRTFRRPRARARAFAGVVHNPEELRPELLWEFYTGGNRGSSFADALTSLAGYDILDRLEEVEVPTLLVWGRQDHVVPSADALEYHRRLANSRLEVFDRCGHLPMAERPVRFNRLLEEFLAE